LERVSGDLADELCWREGGEGGEGFQGDSKPDEPAEGERRLSAAAFFSTGRCTAAGALTMAPDGRAAAQGAANGDNRSDHETDNHEAEEAGYHRHGDQDWPEIDHCEHVTSPFWAAGAAGFQARATIELAAWRPRSMPLLH
jgi:hypothetical protein